MSAGKRHFLSGGFYLTFFIGHWIFGITPEGGFAYPVKRGLRRGEFGTWNFNKLECKNGPT